MTKAVAQKSSLRKKKKNTSSVFKGVSFCKDKKRKKWRAFIKVEGRLIQLGYFQNENDAALAYDDAASKYFGDKAILNLEIINKNTELGV